MEWIVTSTILVILFLVLRSKQDGIRKPIHMSQKDVDRTLHLYEMWKE